MPVMTLRSLGQALVELGAEVKLPDGSALRVVTAAEAALLDLCAEHPFAEIEVETHHGQPAVARVRDKVRLGGGAQP